MAKQQDATHVKGIKSGNAKGNYEKQAGHKPDVSPDAAAHRAGINQGNATGHYERQRGHHPDGRSSAERSTGINADKREPIDPRMPNLSPA